LSMHSRRIQLFIFLPDISELVISHKMCHKYNLSKAFNKETNILDEYTWMQYKINVQNYNSLPAAHKKITIHYKN